MEAKLKQLAGKVFDNKVWMYAENLLFTALFVMMIKGLTDYDTALYQTQKYKQADIFVLGFAAILFLLRKVRLINWQSLLATLIYIPIAVSQLKIWTESPDILGILKFEVVAEWVVLMIIVDMLLYRNINGIVKENISIFILYALMATAMLFHRNGRNDPLYLVLPLGLFMMIKVSSEVWEKIFKCLLNGAFVFFVYTVIKSFIEVPYEHVRYYGYFLNIGAFGMFLSCIFVFALVGILYSKEKYGRKSFFYIASCVWMFMDIVMLWLVSTMTAFAGVGLALSMMFVIGRKDTSKKAILRRILILICLIVIPIIVYFVIVNIYMRHGVWWAYKKARKAGILSPYYAFVYRILRTAKNVDTSSLKRFIFTMLDNLSSNRLTIIKAYSEYFNFNGNAPMYLQVGDYYAMSAHNNYAQVIVDYGYSSACIYFVLVGTSLVTAVKRYFKRGKKILDLSIVLWIVMTLGVWLGEACGFTYPATFIMLIFICRMISERQEEVDGE